MSRAGSGGGGSAGPVPVPVPERSRSGPVMSGRCCQGQTPSRDIPGPGKCLTLPDGAPLPPGDYSTTPGGTVFGTTPGGEHRAGPGTAGGSPEGGRAGVGRRRGELPPVPGGEPGAPPGPGTAPVPVPGQASGPGRERPGLPVLTD